MTIEKRFWHSSCQLKRPAWDDTALGFENYITKLIDTLDEIENHSSVNYNAWNNEALGETKFKLLAMAASNNSFRC